MSLSHLQTDPSLCAETSLVITLKNIHTLHLTLSPMTLSLIPRGNLCGTSSGFLKSPVLPKSNPLEALTHPNPFSFVVNEVPRIRDYCQVSNCDPFDYVCLTTTLLKSE